MAAIEQWKGVLGFEGLYEVSNLGRVRSLTGRGRWPAGRVLALSPSGRAGYLGLRLCGPTRRRRAMVAHLVLEAFVGPRPAGTEAAHGDANNQNNTLDNLAWKTPAANAQDKFACGTQPLGSKHWAAKLTEEGVRAIRSDARRPSEIAREYGVSPSLITTVKQRKGWTHV